MAKVEGILAGLPGRVNHKHNEIVLLGFIQMDWILWCRAKRLPAGMKH